MKKFHLLGSGLLALAISACSQPAEKTAEAAPADAPATSAKADLNDLRIATESNYKPFSYLDAEGKHQGFEIDLIHALCEEMKAKCTIASHDWDSLIPGLTANKYDAIFASMSATDERRKTVNFSDPYFNNKLVLVGKKGDTATIKDIDGKAVAAQQATVASGYIETNHPKAELKIYDKQVNAYLDLSSGRVQYLLSDIAPASDWLKTEQGQDFEVKGEPIDINDNVAIALRKEDTELANHFNTALASLKANGKYKEIASKYFDPAVLGE